MKFVTLAKIDFAGSPCVRALINPEVVSDYKELYEAHKVLPPVDLFQDGPGSRYLVGDGFHRLKAVEAAGKKGLLCNVHSGTWLDALAFACSSNIQHGYRRTHADKRKAVQLALKHWPESSDRGIADKCHCSHVFVGQVRSSLGETATAPMRSGKDGKTRKVPDKKRRACKQPELIVPEIESDLKQCNNPLKRIHSALTALKSCGAFDDPKYKTPLYEIDVAIKEIHLEIYTADSKATGKGIMSMDRAKELCAELALPVSDGEWFVLKCEGMGWKVNGQKIKNADSTFKAWHRAKYFPSQKGSNENNRSSNRNFGTGLDPQSQGKAIADAIQKRTARAAAN